MKAVVTGGAGFIGSHLVKALIATPNTEVITVDKLTYAGHKSNLTEVLANPRHTFVKLDILDYEHFLHLLSEFKPTVIFHLAAESHVDRSIDFSKKFIETNVLGTQMLLEAALRYWKSNNKFSNFKVVHVSTDEVFGSIAAGHFNENSRYNPNSPYAASKAATDMLVKAFHATHNLPAVVANCTNNYGPNQYPEKLIPLCILNALEEKPIPIYGDGQQVRDWIFVTDHVRALIDLAQNGSIGENYCIGANCEKTNREIVTKICKYLDEICPRKNQASYQSLIEFVQDRPGHDRRYSVNSNKIYKELHWSPRVGLNDGLRRTVLWYYQNSKWVSIISNSQTRERKGIENIGSRDKKVG